MSVCRVACKGLCPGGSYSVACKGLCPGGSGSRLAPPSVRCLEGPGSSWEIAMNQCRIAHHAQAGGVVHLWHHVIWAHQPVCCPRPLVLEGESSSAGCTSFASRFRADLNWELDPVHPDLLRGICAAMLCDREVSHPSLQIRARHPREPPHGQG